jgi:uncharacterized membrane protein
VGSPQLQALQVGVQHYSGPIPSAQELQRYEQVQPGLADRIVSMAEKEQGHRHTIETTTMNLDFAEGKRGQIFAFLIGTGAIIVGGYCAIHGANIAGSIIGGGGVVGLVSVFVYGRKHSQITEEPAKTEPSRKKK